jgi:hypothetical protein
VNLTEYILSDPELTESVIATTILILVPLKTSQEAGPKLVDDESSILINEQATVDISPN